MTDETSPKADDDSAPSDDKPVGENSAVSKATDNGAAAPRNPDNFAKKSPTKSARSPSARPPSGMFWLSALLFVLVFIALGGSGYAHWWQYQQQRQQSQQSLQLTDSLQQQLAQQSAQLQRGDEATANLQQQLTALQNTTAALRQQQNTEQNTLTQQLEALNQRLLQLSSTNSENWELAEALYLTRLANQRLVMEQNRETALALMEGADDILARQQDPELFPIREILAQDIAALKVVEAVDREGLFLQLSALSEQVQNLPLTRSLNFVVDEPNGVSADESIDQSLWRKIAGSVQNAFGKLDNYVRKVELEGSPKPILAPEEQQSIRLALNLYLESAQIALLRSQPLVFSNALAQAQQQLINYYPETSQRQELILALQSLQSESVKPALPDISRSYLRLHDFIQGRANSGQRDDKTDTDTVGTDTGDTR